MSETPPIPEQPKILSFEEFINKKNNFYLYFGWAQSSIAEAYRTAAHYQRFASEHPERATSLRNKIQNLRGLPDDEVFRSIESLNPDLYEAYKIMRCYVVSDKDLFA